MRLTEQPQSHILLTRKKGKVMDTIYSCRECNYQFTIKAGEITTANVKIHCGKVMNGRQVPTKAPENVLDTIDKVALGSRLQEARLSREHSLIAVYDITELPVGRVGAIEQGLTQATPHELITLAHLYRVQLYQLLNPLPEGLTHIDILGMYCREEISEGVACHELGVDRLELHVLVEEYQKSSPSEGEGGRTDV